MNRFENDLQKKDNQLFISKINITCEGCTILERVILELDWEILPYLDIYLTKCNIFNDRPKYEKKVLYGIHLSNRDFKIIIFYEI